MGLALKKEPETFRFDREAYLAWEAEQDGKHEYQAGEVVAMGGARQAHVLVSLRLASWLLRQLDGSPCRAYMSDMKLLIGVDSARSSRRSSSARPTAGRSPLPEQRLRRGREPVGR